jgi:hypothetical protein
MMGIGSCVFGTNLGLRTSTDPAGMRIKIGRQDDPDRDTYAPNSDAAKLFEHIYNATSAGKKLPNATGTGRKTTLARGKISKKTSLKLLKLKPFGDPLSLFAARLREAAKRNDQDTERVVKTIERLHNIEEKYSKDSNAEHLEAPVTISDERIVPYLKDVMKFEFISRNLERYVKFMRAADETKLTFEEIESRLIASKKGGKSKKRLTSTASHSPFSSLISKMNDKFQATDFDLLSFEDQEDDEYEDDDENFYNQFYDELLEDSDLPYFSENSKSSSGENKRSEKNFESNSESDKSFPQILQGNITRPLFPINPYNGFAVTKNSSGNTIRFLSLMRPKHENHLQLRPIFQKNHNGITTVSLLSKFPKKNGTSVIKNFQRKLPRAYDPSPIPTFIPKNAAGPRLFVSL